MKRGAVTNKRNAPSRMCGVTTHTGWSISFVVIKKMIYLLKVMITVKPDLLAFDLQERLEEEAVDRPWPNIHCLLRVIEAPGWDSDSDPVSTL
ncbi:MAG: hypothetical protein NVS2B2_17390 [Ktedonobacteraceae bacterium]